MTEEELVKALQAKMREVNDLIQQLAENKVQVVVGTITVQSTGATPYMRFNIEHCWKDLNPTLILRV